MKRTIINLCLIIVVIAMGFIVAWYIEDVKGISVYNGYNSWEIRKLDSLISYGILFIIGHTYQLIDILQKKRRVRKTDWWIVVISIVSMISAYGIERSIIILFKPFTMTKIYAGITIYSVLLLLLAHVINKKRGFIEVPKKGKRKK